MMSGKLRWIALLLSGMLGVLPMAAGVPGETVGGRSVGLALLGTGVMTGLLQVQPVFPLRASKSSSPATTTLRKPPSSKGSGTKRWRV